MPIFRNVTVHVYCDICGGYMEGWSGGNGVSKSFAAYYVRQHGATTGEKIICKKCRIAKKISICKLKKKRGIAENQNDGTCPGALNKNGELTEKCKGCIAYSDFKTACK